MDQGNGNTKRLVIGLAVGAVFGLGVGLLVGLAFGYRIAPLEWADAGPQDLREDYGAYYWELAAESYAQHGDLERVRRQLGQWDDPAKLETVLGRARIEANPELKMVLDSLEPKVVEPLPTTAPGEVLPGEAPAEGAKISWLPIFLLFVLLVATLALVGLLVVRIRKRRQEPTALEDVEEAPEWLATMRPEESAPPLPALGHFVTSYALGNDNYDESFSIETGTGEFLGECGVGISETIGVGDPDKVTAFEIWLFDKNDIRTVTKVMMSEHAFHDQELRASLAPKGEAVLAQPNVPVVLETATLRIEATTTEMIYGTGALPPNSFLDRLTVELVARQKEPGVAELTSTADQLAL